MFELNSAMIYFFIRRFHYPKSSIKLCLSNKPPLNAFSGEES